MIVNISRSVSTHLIVRGQSTAQVLLKNPSERVRIVQSASPIPVTQGVPTVLDGGNF